MKWPAVHAAAARAANDDRDAGAPAVAAFRREICDLVEGARNEVGELHLRNGTHTHQRSAYGCADDGRFRDRRVDDALFTKLFQHAGGDLECSAVNADVFTKDEDAFVLLHLLPDAL